MKDFKILDENNEYIFFFRPDSPETIFIATFKEELDGFNKLFIEWYIEDTITHETMHKVLWLLGGNELCRYLDNLDKNIYAIEEEEECLDYIYRGKVK